MLNHKKFCSLEFWYCILFVIWCLLFVICTNAYALDLDKARTYFIEGDYASCIKEGERILGVSGQDRNMDELYYLLGVSYLKEERYLRASDIFEIIMNEFKDSSYRDEARLGLGDTFFLRGNYVEAAKEYGELLKLEPRTDLKAAAYYRLSRAAFKEGNKEKAGEYLDKLRREFPQSPEALLDKDTSAGPDLYYTVQAGAFSSPDNAKTLTEKLVKEGYPAYTEEVILQGKKTFRVRVGKLKSRRDAQLLHDSLSRNGYPTRICP
ncbi:SPOR domain-containing protein [Candidatus Omnitrophota bacterium]